jgi:hypothetical protein
MKSAAKILKTTSTSLQKASISAALERASIIAGVSEPQTTQRRNTMPATKSFIKEEKTEEKKTSNWKFDPKDETYSAFKIIKAGLEIAIFAGAIDGLLSGNKKDSATQLDTVSVHKLAGRIPVSLQRAYNNLLENAKSINTLYDKHYKEALISFNDSSNTHDTNKTNLKSPSTALVTQVLNGIGCDPQTLAHISATVASTLTEIPGHTIFFAYDTAHDLTSNLSRPTAATVAATTALGAIGTTVANELLAQGTVTDAIKKVGSKVAQEVTDAKSGTKKSVNKLLQFQIAVSTLEGMKMAYHEAKKQDIDPNRLESIQESMVKLEKRLVSMSEEIVTMHGKHLNQDQSIDIKNGAKEAKIPLISRITSVARGVVLSDEASALISTAIEYSIGELPGHIAGAASDMMQSIAHNVTAVTINALSHSQQLDLDNVVMGQNIHQDSIRAERQARVSPEVAADNISPLIKHRQRFLEQKKQSTTSIQQAAR